MRAKPGCFFPAEVFSERARIGTIKDLSRGSFKIKAQRLRSLGRISEEIESGDVEIHVRLQDQHGGFPCEGPCAMQQDKLRPAKRGIIEQALKGQRICIHRLKVTARAQRAVYMDR